MTSPVTSEAWVPSLKKCFGLLFVVRLVIALFVPIADCDETFNYWEPSHMLAYGRGLETWEYR
jgi:alpha-1,2-mannosyltransferase